MKTTVPADWEIRTLKELGHGTPSIVQTGPFGAQLHAEDYVEDGVPLILIRNLKDGSLDLTAMPKIREEDARRLCRYSLYSGDVVFSRVGRVGSCFLANADQAGWLISGQLLRVRISDCEINLRYLYRALTSKYAQDHIRGESVGTTRTSINTKILESLPLLVPISKSEQSTIADVLSAVDRAIEHTEVLIAKQQRIKTGLMQDLLTRGIDEDGNLRSERTHKFKDSPLGRISEEWTLQTLERCVKNDSPICYGILMPGANHDNGIPVIKVRDIIRGRIFQDNILLTDPKIDKQYERSRLRQGDVLITIRGTTGRIAIVPSELDGANITQDTARVRLKGEHSNQCFYFLLQSKGVQDQVSLHTVGQAVKGINIEDVKRIRFAIPTKKEQLAMVVGLDGIQRTLEAADRELKKLCSLKTGLMQDLLTGRKRVTALLEPDPKCEKVYAAG